MTEDSVILVCEACGQIEFVPSGDDPWEDFTRTVRHHQQSSQRCRGARQWVGQNLEDCPLPVPRGNGTVN